MFGKKKYLTAEEATELAREMGTSVGSIVLSIHEIRDVIDGILDEDRAHEQSWPPEVHVTVIVPVLRKLLVDQLIDAASSVGDRVVASEIVEQAKILEAYVTERDEPKTLGGLEIIEDDRIPEGGLGAGLVGNFKSPSDPFDADEDPFGYGDTPFGGEKSSVDVGQVPFPGTEIVSDTIKDGGASFPGRRIKDNPQA